MRHGRSGGACHRRGVAPGRGLFARALVTAIGPATSAVILMEMIREPGPAGPLMPSALVARWVSAWVQPEPLHHPLSHSWRLKTPVR